MKFEKNNFLNFTMFSLQSNFIKIEKCTSQLTNKLTFNFQTSLLTFKTHAKYVLRNKLLFNSQYVVNNEIQNAI